jgi:hypothetical protein
MRKYWGLSSITKYIDYLAGLPVSENIDGIMLVAHDNLANPGNGCYMCVEKDPRVITLDEELLTDLSMVQLDKAGVSVGFIGHTHHPRVYVTPKNSPEDHKIFQPDRRFYELSDDNFMLFNVGSVGQPRDENPRACYALVYCDDNKVKALEYRRVEYNVEKAVSHLRWSFIDRFIRRKGTETLRIHHKYLRKEYGTTIAKMMIDRLRKGK